MPLDLVPLHRDAKGSARWLDTVVDRIQDYSRRFEGDADALVSDVWTLYAQKSPALGLWAVIQDERVVGHLLAFIRQWDGQNVAWVTQLVIDAQPVPREFRDAGMRMLESWVEQFNLVTRTQPNLRVDTMMMSTARSAAAWLRHYGFEEYRTLCRRRLRRGG
ncbi:MAG TPA: hypothetical protein DCQ64_01400 [Candidatus Rokubacteria bacterium]|nr:hypothetical protein [Candidatus Rokubacteria bacterium]